VGAIFVPIYLVAAAIQWVVLHLASVAPLLALDGRHGAVTAFLAVLVGGIGGLFASVIATAAVAVILDELDAGRRILVGQAYRRVFRRLRPLAKAMLMTEILMVVVLTITVVGIPFRGPSLHPLVPVRSGKHARGPPGGRIAASQLRARPGRWWRTFAFTLLVAALAALSGPLLGVGLLLLTDHSLNFINLAAALVYTLTVPYAAIQLTLYYFDLEARGVATPALVEV
jgi:hypothetical protein